MASNLWQVADGGWTMTSISGRQHVLVASINGMWKVVIVEYHLTSGVVNNR